MSKRLTFFDDAAAHLQELRWAWRDRDLTDFQTGRGAPLFGRVEAWVVSDVNTNGVQVLLRPGVPMLAVNNLEYFDSALARTFRRGARTLARPPRLLAESDGRPRLPLAYLQRRRFPVAGDARFWIFLFGAHAPPHALIELVLPEKRERPKRPNAP